MNNGTYPSMIQPANQAPNFAMQQAANNTFGNPQAPGAKTDRSSLMKTVLLVVSSVFAIVFAGLFVWMWINWYNANTNVEGRIKLAAQEAETAMATEKDNEYAEKEKYPFYTYTGPSDYGSLSFKYPKTWSVYVPEDGRSGGDFHAFFNPKQVGHTDDTNPLALRVSIIGEMTDQVLEDYNDKVQDQEMTLKTVVVNGANVNVYTGLLDSDLQGIVCVFKIRDKTAIIQTDSLIYENDFNQILGSMKFNK